MKIIEEVKVIHDKSGFGIIHEVIADNGENYARKTFRPNIPGLDADTLVDIRRRFSREVRIQEKLSPDFCIPIIYSELEDENPWFLMPIAEKTFGDEIIEAKEEKRVPEGFADIINCLEYLHQRGYTHRDIKPGNILLYQGSWKLADMGLITADPNLTTSFVTKNGIGYGSQPYMAPEQYLDFQNVTRHADIYSFGAILHDIFDGRNRKPYSQLTAPGAIGFIIEKCTEEHPQNRFDNVGILRDVLLSRLTQQELPIEINEEINNWIGRLKEFSKWTNTDLDSFITLIEREENSRSGIFFEISSSFIEYTYNLNERYWKRFVKIYLMWIENTNFEFNYCDVLIGHIIKIYNLTDDLSIKSLAVFSAAELGKSHNRWFVMKKVVELCSPEISNILAERIAIEIYAIGPKARINLLRCVERLNKTIADYHIHIQNSLN